MIAQVLYPARYADNLNEDLTGKGWGQLVLHVTVSMV